MYHLLNRLTKNILPSWLYERLIGTWNKEGLKKYFANTGWMFISRFCTLTISFFLTIYIIRYLGPYNYGLLSYAVSFVGLFSIIANLGMDQIVYREIVKHPDKETEILGTSLVLRLIGGAIASGLAVGIGFLVHENSIDRVLIAIISLTLLGSAIQTLIHPFNARVLSKYPYFIILGTTIILSIVKILIIYFDKGIIYFAFTLLLESILYILFYLFFYTRRLGSVTNFSFLNVRARSLLIDSFPLLLSTVSILIYYRIDQVMLRYYFDASAVGLYDAAVRLSDAWYIIPSILISSFFPAIVNARKNNDYSYIYRLKQLGWLLTGLSLFVIIPSVTLSDWIILTLYGEAYIQSTIVLQIYIWSLIGFSLGQLMSTYLITENYTFIYLITSVTTMLLNVGLNFLLIPDHGLAGAAIATLISYSLIPIIPFIFKKVRRDLLTKPTATSA